MSTTARSASRAVPTTHYQPDVETLQAAPARIVVVVVATSKGQLAQAAAGRPDSFWAVMERRRRDRFGPGLAGRAAAVG